MRQILDRLEVKVGVIVLILAGLVLVGRYGIDKQKQAYWRDAVRKDDLTRIRQAVVDYFQEYGELPNENTLKACGSGHLQPYIKATPCDPITGEAYPFEKSEDCADCYNLFAKLENVKDLDIENVGCSQGCGAEGKYNYKIRVWLVRQEKEKE